MGQRQLLSFTRALVKNPDLIILDEATASIDPKSEEFIQKGIEHIIRERTVLVVAHRLSTVSSCDKILVLDNGFLVEQGDHETLLKEKGRYYSLYHADGFDDKKQINEPGEAH